MGMRGRIGAGACWDSFLTQRGAKGAGERRGKIAGVWERQGGGDGGV
jgi:hypothetical protein